MTSVPLVSVVVPVHDGEAYLGEALRSVLDQRWPRLQVVVVDDGSSDASADIAAAMGVDCIRQPNRGVASARNTGVAAARGSYLAFLDQDDRWSPGKLPRQIGVMEDDRRLDFTLGHQQTVLEPGVGRPAWLKPELLEGPSPGYLPGTLVVRRAAFARVGPFDESIPLASDADWFFRAKDAGLRSLVLPDVLLERRIHGGNLSARTSTNHAQLLRALRASVARQRSGESGE